MYRLPLSNCSSLVVFQVTCISRIVFSTDTIDRRMIASRNVMRRCETQPNAQRPGALAYRILSLSKTHAASSHASTHATSITIYTPPHTSFTPHHAASRLCAVLSSLLYSYIMPGNSTQRDPFAPARFDFEESEAARTSCATQDSASCADS